jgi:phospholipase C
MWELPKVKHIVVLMQENHSYDNYLGTLTGRGDGLILGPDGTPCVVNVLPNGQKVAAHHFTSTRVACPGRDGRRHGRRAALWTLEAGGEMG